MIGWLKRRGDTPGVFVFLHVPKTGGTALTTMLARQFPGRRHYAVQHSSKVSVVAEIAGLRSRRRKAIHLVSGHMEFGVHEAFDAPCSYFTVLREPIDRVVSHYCYAASEPRHYMYRRIHAERISLEQYVQMPEMIEVNNGQARLVAGMHDQTRYPFGFSDRQVLETATAHLTESFRVVGLLERFDDSVDLVCRRFGWRRPTTVKRMVTAARITTADLPPSTRSLIVERNQADIALFARATQIFERLLAE